MIIVNVPNYIHVTRIKYFLRIVYILWGSVKKIKRISIIHAGIL